MFFKKHIKKEFMLYYFGHAYNDICFLIVPLLLPFIRNEFNLSYFQSGLILTSHMGMRSLFTFISGHLGDRFDKRVIISLGFVFSSVFLALLIFANTYMLILIILMIMAIGVSTFHPLATALVGEEADSKHRAFQIGVFESIGVSGIILASITFGVFADNLGWRLISFSLAIPGIVLAISFLIKRKEEINYNISAERKVGGFYILLFLLAKGVRGFGMENLISFLPTFGADYLGLGGGDTSWLITLFFTGCILGFLFSGWLADVKDPFLIIVFSVFIAIVAVVGITFLNSLILILASVILLGVSNGGFFTPQNCWLTTVSTQSTRGKTMGAAYFIDGFSTTIAPAFFGWLADQIGLLGSFRWTLLPIVISMLLLIKLYKLIQ